jgi:hypothetical protein
MGCCFQLLPKFISKLAPKLFLAELWKTKKGMLPEHGFAARARRSASRPVGNRHTKCEPKLISYSSL